MIGKAFKWIFPTAVFLSLAACQRSDHLSTTKMGGFGVDNGGGTITCRPDPELREQGGSYFEGIYALDYYLTFDPRISNDDLDGESWDDYRRQVTAFLSDKLPNLRSSFDQFANLLESGDHGQFRVWEASDIGLTEVGDLGLIQQPKRNCVVTRDGNVVPDFQQVVRRRYVDGATAQKIFYFYDFEKFRHLRHQLSLQFSYLAVHEWLWDFADSPWVNRSINHLIHTKTGQRLTAAEFQDYLRSMGVRVSPSGFIGTDGAQEQVTREVFQQEPLCRYERRLTAEFVPSGQAIVLQAGEERTLTVQVASQSDSVGQSICGTALMLSHRTIGEHTGTGTLSVGLRRGIPFVPPVTFNVQGSLQQSAMTGVCRDRLCAIKEGQLERLVFPGSFLGSRWQLTVKNTSASQTIEVRMPYLLFVDMRQQL